MVRTPPIKRATAGLENIQLIALTGYGQQEDRRKTREAGFDHHLVKPVDIRAVVAILKQRGSSSGG